ncbi:MAG: hypothetical protein CMI00_05550 [Oceanospirillaceae bacterium]|nr:hypothetical protein [Oceanospirillaceae bacterium]|tara:strand:- start:4534 stop:5073 length:540 start_codon:yes stop_codon:yes gene_type:complete
MRLPVLLALAVLSFPALASDRDDKGFGLIFGPGIMFGSFSSPDSDSAAPNSVSLSLEKPVNKNFAWRADYAFGIDGDDTEFEGLTYNVEVDRIFSGFMKLHFGSEWSQYYALVGFSKGEFSAHADFLPAYRYSDMSLSWGAGVGMKVDHKTLMSLEYISYMAGGDVDFAGFGLRFTQEF